MTVLLKNKRHKFATMMLSIFIGSWMLLLCQTCFAAHGSDQRVDHSTEIETKIPCHDSTTVSADDEICSESCDCDELNITINSDTNPEQKVKIKYSQDATIPSEQKITLSNRAPPSEQISAPPDRAILLPLDSFNVLII